MSDLELIFGGALSGVILYSAYLAAKTICGKCIERSIVRSKKERDKNAREQKMISLLEENLSRLEENLTQLEK